MHTHAKNGVGVSVINGTTNCSALGVELDSGLMLARVPHGPVKVRISAQHDVEVQLYFEDEKRLSTTLSAGTHTIERDSNGQPILFTAPEDVVDDEPESDDEIPELRDDNKLPDYVQTALQVIKASGNSQVKSINPASAAPAAVDDELSFSAVTRTPSQPAGVAAPAAAPSAGAEGKAKRQLSRGFLAVIVKHAEKPTVPGVVPPSYDEAVVTFQLNAPEKHYKAVAANFHRIVPPEATTKPWCSCCNH